MISGNLPAEVAERLHDHCMTAAEERQYEQDLERTIQEIDVTDLRAFDPEGCDLVLTLLKSPSRADKMEADLRLRAIAEECAKKQLTTD